MKLTRTTFLLGCLVGGGSAALIPLLFTSIQAETKLLPFQGRLTDASGAALADGAKVVEFKMYDAPTGGNVKWVGEVHKLSVNGGLVNTILGSKSSLGSVDFSTPSFLQITVDANGDGHITATDPPLLPRQSVVPAVYAVVAGGLQYSGATGPASVTGSTLLDAEGKIKAGEIAANNAITASQLANDSVETAELKNEAVTLIKLAPEVTDALGGIGSVTSAKIKDGDLQTVDIAGKDGVGAVPGAVTTEKILDGTIRGQDIADSSVPLGKIIQEYAVFWDERGNTVTGGTPVSGWNKRTLNQSSIRNGSTFASRTGDTITLEPGVYWINASAPGHRVRRHAIALRDVTGSPSTPVIALKGTTEHCSDIYSGLGEVDQNRSFINGFLTVTGSSRQYELWHWIQVPSPDGMGGFPDAVGPGWSLWASISILKIN